jgi:hypothetical protein
MTAVPRAATALEPYKFRGKFQVLHIYCLYGKSLWLDIFAS